ncbi:MAG: hypothetical protein ABS939_16090 [Psychrobacillus sp.]
MSRKRRIQTHTVGFNVTSLKGLSGVYIFCNSKGDFAYVGSCKDKDITKENWRSRLRSHNSYSGKKLTSEVQYMDVIIPPQDISEQHLYALEHLFMWYLRPQKNLSKGLSSHWKYFRWDWTEEVVKKVAKDKYKIEISTNIDEFLMSFDLIRIQREYDENGGFKKYGDTERIESPFIACNKKRNCSCFNCKARKRHKSVFRK